MAASLAQARTEADQARQEIAAKERALRAAQEQAQGLEGEQGQVRAELDAARAELVQARQRQGSLRTEIVQARDDAAASRQAVQAAEGQAAQAQAELARLRDSAEQGEATQAASTAQAQAQAQQARDTLAERDAELEALRMQLGAAQTDLAEAFSSFRADAIAANQAREEAEAAARVAQAELQTARSQAQQAAGQAQQEADILRGQMDALHESLSTPSETPPSEERQQLERELSDQVNRAALLEGMLETTRQQLEAAEAAQGPMGLATVSQDEVNEQFETIKAIILANRDIATDDSTHWKKSEVAIGKSIKELLALAHRLPQHLDEVYRVLGSLQDILDVGKRIVRRGQQRAEEEVQALGELDAAWSDAAEQQD